MRKNPPCYRGRPKVSAILKVALYVLAHMLLNALICSLMSVEAFPATDPVSDSVKSAQDVVLDKSTPRGTMRTDVKSIIVCLVMLGVGIFYCFFGFRMFVPTMFITGFYLAVNFAFPIINKIEPFDTLQEPKKTIYFVVLIVLGIVAGYMLVWFYNCGIFVIGIAGGYALFMMLSTIIAVSQTWAVIALLIICIILGVVLIHWFEKLVIISATALIGAVAIVMGVDVIINQGYTHDMMARLNGNPVEFTGNSALEGFVSMILAVIGFTYQYYANAGSSIFGGDQRK